MKAITHANNPGTSEFYGLGMPLCSYATGNHFEVKKSGHVWCFETIRITNSYIFGSTKGTICV